MNEEYFTEHPWSGDNGSHEDWEKVLTLKALALGGNIMYLWVRGEGPEITAANLDRIGNAIHGYIEAIDFKSAEKAWNSDYFWSTDYQKNWRQTRLNQIYVLACGQLRVRPLPCGGVAVATEHRAGRMRRCGRRGRARGVRCLGTSPAPCGSVERALGARNKHVITSVGSLLLASPSCRHRKSSLVIRV